MTMTLREVSAMLRGDRSPESLWQQSEEMADAIDAHLVGMGEPVVWRYYNLLGEVVSEWIDGNTPDKHFDLCGNDITDQITVERAYLAPPIDIAAVCEVIAILDRDGDEWGCAAKLTAALPKETP
jgi:hypothetical protein